MRLLSTVFWIFLCWFPLNASAQDMTIFGEIHNEIGQPIPNAHIHFGDYTMISNPMGEFEIMNLYAKQYRLEISHLGFQTRDTIIVLQKDLRLKFVLSSKNISLQNVTVFQKKKIQVGTTTHSKIETEAILNKSYQSLGDLLRDIPGVSTLKSGSNLVKPVIQGLHSSRVILVNQNIKQEDQSWGLDHAPAMESHQFGSIELVQGASTLRHGGDAVGGMLVTQPKVVAWKDTLKGYFRTSTFSNGRGMAHILGLQKGLKNGWFGTFSSTYKIRGDQNAPNYYLNNTGSREIQAATQIGYREELWGISGHYSFYQGITGILRASHIGNVTDLVQAINQTVPINAIGFNQNIAAPRQEVSHHQASISFFHKLNDFGKLSLDYGFQGNQRYEFDSRRGNLQNRPAVDMRLLTQSLNAHFESKVQNGMRFESGFNFAYQNNDSDTQNTGVRALIPDYQKLESGIYANIFKSIQSNWNLEAGVRWDYAHIQATQYYLKSRWEFMNYQNDFAHFITDDFGTQWRTLPMFDYQGLSGTAGSLWNINSKNSLILRWQATNRNPNPAELFSDGLHHGTGQIELGDLRLVQERGHKFTAEWEFKHDKSVISVVPFVQRIQNFSMLTPVGTETTIRGAFPVWQYQQVHAQLWGFDLIWHQKITKNGQWKNQVSWLEGTDLDKNQPLIDMPPLVWKQQITWQKTNWQNLELSLLTETIFTQKRFPNNNFEALVPQNGEIVPVWVNISQPPRGYHLWQLNGHTTWETKRLGIDKGNLKTGIVIENLWNTSYRDYLNRMRFYADDLGRNWLVYVQLNF